MAMEPIAKIVQPVAVSINFANLSASAAAKNGPGMLTGIFVASASGSPTIKVWNSLAGSGAVLVNTFTPSGGTWYPMPFPFDIGCFVTIGGTVDCTVGFQ